MKTKSETNIELAKLLVAQLQDVLWAEKALVRALPKNAALAEATELRAVFAAHHKETLVHVQRLNEAFATLGLRPRAKKCEAMAGLLAEAEELAEEYEGSPALDAALICAAQKIEHYEVATYGTLRAFAKTLGFGPVADLMGRTLAEERDADTKLSEIGQKSANRRAAGAATRA